MGLILLLAAMALTTACGAGGIRYVLMPPEVKEIRITGLTPGDTIIEVFDNYKGKNAELGNLWIQVKRGSSYLLGKINFNSGVVSNLEPNYGDSARYFYWTNLQESIMDEGSRMLGCCLSMTAFGGTTEKYGFEAEKIFWGDREESVKISFQYKRQEATYSYGGFITPAYSYTDTKEFGGAIQSFIKGEKIYGISRVTGYAHNFNVDGNVLKARFYPVNETNYVGIQPASLKKCSSVVLFHYDTEQLASYGAVMDFPSGIYYVDAGLPLDSDSFGIIDQSGDDYFLLLYKVDQLTRAIQLLKVMQQGD